MVRERCVGDCCASGLVLTVAERFGARGENMGSPSDDMEKPKDGGIREANASRSNPFFGYRFGGQSTLFWCTEPFRRMMT